MPWFRLLLSPDNSVITYSSLKGLNCSLKCFINHRSPDQFSIVEIVMSLGLLIQCGKVMCPDLKFSNASASCWKWSNVNGIRNVGLQRSLGGGIPAMPDTETRMLRYPPWTRDTHQPEHDRYHKLWHLISHFDSVLPSPSSIAKVNFSESVQNLFRVSLCDGNPRQITFAWNVWHQKVTTTSWMEDSLWHEGFLGGKIF